MRKEVFPVSAMVVSIPFLKVCDAIPRSPRSAIVRVALDDRSTEPIDGSNDDGVTCSGVAEQSRSPGRVVVAEPESFAGNTRLCPDTGGSYCGEVFCHDPS